jgi:hypothetical protein
LRSRREVNLAVRHNIRVGDDGLGESSGDGGGFVDDVATRERSDIGDGRVSGVVGGGDERPHFAIGYVRGKCSGLGGGGRGSVLRKSTLGKRRDERAGGLRGEIAQNNEGGGDKEKSGRSNHNGHRKRVVDPGLLGIGVFDNHEFILALLEMFYY